MTRMIFVNLPVADLDASKAFYEAIGARNEPNFTDETAACMVFSETIFVMLLTHDKWRHFDPRPIPDAHETCPVMLAISCDSAEAVDRMTEAAANGGTVDPHDKQDLGFMYARSFADPDGHIWEPMWMDPQAAAEGPPKEATA